MPQDAIRFQILDEARQLNDTVQDSYNDLFSRISEIGDSVKKKAAFHALGQISDRAFLGVANARKEIWDAEKANLDAFRREVASAQEQIKKSLEQVAEVTELLKQIATAVDTFVQYSAALLP